MKNVETLICPICKNKLNQVGNSLKCKQNHSFDISKEGYVNLLLVNKKHSQIPGDSIEQVRARRDFFSKNYFEPLVNTIKNLLKNRSGILLDAGCGTGYYLNSLKGQFSCIGIDISKEAVKIASKMTKELSIVASVFDMPIMDNCADVILSIFAPKPLEEFNRVLKNDGVIVEVIPSVYHMVELKEKMYENIYLNDIDDKKLEGFSLLSSGEVKYSVDISREDIMSLIKMTPYVFSGKMSKKFNTNQKVTLHFLVKLWEKQKVKN